MRLRTLVAPLMLTAALLAGCEGEVSIGEKTLASGEIEKQAEKALSEQVGQTSPPITCPADGLKAEVGERATCSMKLDGETYDVAVTITAVDGDTAKFGVKVADKPRAKSS